jgi:hypothetical protein
MLRLGRLEMLVTPIVEGSQGAAVGGPLAPGAHVRVRRCRGRLATRAGTVLVVHGFEGSVYGRQISVRWDDDGSVSWLVPGADIELAGS